MTEDFCATCFCDWWRRFLYKDLVGCDFVFIFVVRMIDIY